MRKPSKIFYILDSAEEIAISEIIFIVVRFPLFPLNLSNPVNHGFINSHTSPLSRYLYFFPYHQYMKFLQVLHQV